MSRGKRALPALLGLLNLTCHQAILTAPPGSSIQLFANPTFIPANGGVSVISALVIEPAGTPVPDGTVVQFFTDLGRIDEQGKTNDGVARVNLVSDSRSGTANVRAFSGGTSGTGGTPATTTAGSTPASTTATPTSPQGGGVTVTIGNPLGATVLVHANPTRIRSTDPRETSVTATVLDASGNFVMNVPVFFSVESPGTTPGAAATEFMESGGSAPKFTDSNGQAFDVMRTRYDMRAAQKTVAVRATTANNKTGTALVVIN